MEININGQVAFTATGAEVFDPALPCIIFLHGAGQDHTVWTLFNRYYAKKQFNSLAVDLPGHNRSAGEPLTSIEDMSRWLIELVQVLDIEKTALVGHSMGALIALEAASQLLTKVTTLILLGVAVPMPVGEPLLAAAKEHNPVAVDMIMLYAHSQASQIGGNPVAGIHILNSNRRLMERYLKNNILYTDLNACNAYSRGLDAASSVTAPVTLVLGEEDKMTPPGGSGELRAALKQPRIDILDECGHLMLSEKPEAVHQSILAALINTNPPPPV